VLRRAAGVLVAVLTLAGASVVALPAAADQVRDREYWLADYGFSDAWATTRGAGVTVAVIDTGIDGSHPDLVGAVVGGTDVSGVGSSDGQGPVGAEEEHGTLVASLVAGRGHGDGGRDGVIGVAPEADLLSVSVGFGLGSATSDQQVADAVRWSVDHGADVINMSLTRNTLDWPESWDDAFLYAMQNDVVVVAAAGNRGSGTSEVGAPATMPGVLAVAGVDENREASFDASSQGITIGVAAPSEGLVGAGPGDGYFEWSGTSGSAPLVAGLVALVRSAHPELDAANVINRVIATATPVGAQLPSPIYGYGLIDAEAAVGDEVGAVADNPLGDLSEWVRLYRRADAPAPSAPPSASEVPDPVDPSPLESTAGGTDAASGPSAPRPGLVDVLLPGPLMLREVGIPLLVIGVFTSLLIAVGAFAVRRFRAILRRR
jgi:type VII secretion-associated serine protease mycosin